MKTYIYRSKDGDNYYEIKQKFGADALTEHPDTGEPIVRVITSANFELKGSGYYSKDNAKIKVPVYDRSSAARSAG